MFMVTAHYGKFLAFSVHVVAQMLHKLRVQVERNQQAEYILPAGLEF